MALQTEIPQENITPDSPDQANPGGEDLGASPEGVALRQALTGALTEPPPQGPVGPDVMSDWIARSNAAKARESSMADTKVNMDLLSGKIDATGIPKEMWQHMFRATQFYNEALGGFAQEVSRNQAQLLQVRGNPLLNVLTTVSGQMAQQQNMPGIVQALGRANLQLNPTAQQLQQERIQLLQGQAAMAGQQMGHMSQLAALSERARHNTVTEQQGQTKLDDTAIAKETNRIFTDAAKYGAIPSEEAFMQRARQSAVYQRGAMTDDAFRALYADAKQRYASGQMAKDIENQRKMDLASYKEGLQEKLANAQLPLWQKKAEFQDALRKGMVDYQTASEMRKQLYMMDAKADEQFRKIPPKDMENLEKMSEMNDFLSRLDKVSRDPVFNGYMGPWNPALILQSRWFKQLESPQQQYVQTLFGHEFPRGVDISGAMSRGFTQAEQPIINKLIASQTQTPEQARETIKVIRESAFDKQAKVIKAYPEAPYEKISYLLGDNPDVWKLVDQVKAKSQSVGRRTTSPATGATTFTPTDGSAPTTSGPNTGVRPAAPAGTAGPRNQAKDETVPSVVAQAFQGKQEGHQITFGNGQVWQMTNGAPKRIK